MKEKKKQVRKEKKMINRFTLQFNPENPLHANAMDTLNQLGYKKADYIAVLIHNSLVYNNDVNQELITREHAESKAQDIDRENILAGLKSFL